MLTAHGAGILDSLPGSFIGVVINNTLYSDERTPSDHDGIKEEKARKQGTIWAF